MENIIEERKAEIKHLHNLWEYVKELNVTVGLNQSTLDDVQAKISSRLAFCERSILDRSNPELLT